MSGLAALGAGLQEWARQRSYKEELERVKQKELALEQLRQDTLRREDMIRQEKYDREDFRYQQEMERDRDRYLMEQEDKNRERLDRLSREERIDKRAERQLGLQAQAQRDSRDYRAEMRSQREAASQEKQSRDEMENLKKAAAQIAETNPDMERTLIAIELSNASPQEKARALKEALTLSRTQRLAELNKVK